MRSTTASVASPASVPDAATWKAAIEGHEVKVGGVPMTDLVIVATDRAGSQIKIPVNKVNLAAAVSTGEVRALVAKKPLAAVVPSPHTDQAATIETMIQAPKELRVEGTPGATPGIFTLAGNIKLFGKIDTDIYSYYGNARIGLRQAVLLVCGIVKISDLMLILTGSPLELV